MTDTRAITKKSLPYKSMDYNVLRKEGIALLEKYSGNRWTDFNVHDPGVTILEVLCYVLTELGYKANFPLEDILYSAPDKTGFTLAENAFYTAQDIFPCQPVTNMDFRKLLIDRIEAVNNAWVFLSDDKEVSGLLEVWLLPDDDATASDEDIIKEAYELLASHRNLCEDVAGISVLPRKECQLEATIFIETKIDPEKTAARILFELEKRLLNPILLRYSVAQMLEQNIPLETIFEGPEMHHGYFSKNSLSDFPAELDLLKVMNTILDIEGVYHISDLAVVCGGKRYTDHIVLDHYLPIFLPKFNIEGGHKLSFYKNDTLLPFQEAESVQLYEQLKSQERRNYTIDTATKTALNFKEGRFRNISNYLSIQHEFPHVYGIGTYGLPPHSSEERRAQAKQLKGFLLHFEQLLANSFSQLANLKKLFSVYPVDQTYFHQPITDVPKHIPLIEDDSNGETTLSEEEIRIQHYGKWNGFVEDEAGFLKRRNSFLNHLLARFNVSFNETIYYDFGYFSDRNITLKELIKAKEYYLQHLVSLSRNRGQGINYLQPSEEGIGLSFKKQLELLLNIENSKNKRLSSAVENIVFDLLFMRENTDEEDDENDDYTFTEESILEDFLRTGRRKDQYRVEELPVRSDAYSILLNLENDNITIELGIVETMEEAVEEIDTICERILNLSRETEGFYVVEHLLLRHLKKEDPEEKDPFYDHRMSLIFPSWPVRFQKKGFREQARLMISDIVPAHIQVDCFWVDLETMLVFENMWELFMAALKEDPQSDETSQYATSLKKILESYDVNV